MKEIISIVHAYNSIDFSSTRAVLATVARVEGSSYRRTGARMLVLDNGNYLGGISGGCLEGDALRRAQKAMVLNKPSIVTYDTTEDDSQQVGIGLGCNGIIDVLFTPLDPVNLNNPVRLLSGLTTTRMPRAVVSITDCDNTLNALGKTLLFENEQQFISSFHENTFAAAVGKDVANCLADETSRTITYTHGLQTIKVFIEIIVPVTRLIVYGSNYDIYPLIRVTRELGWEVNVVTNISKADKALFSLASKVIPLDKTGDLIADHYTAIILMAHDYNTDFDNLQKVLPNTASYIGLLGPRKRAQKMFDHLSGEGRGISKEDERRIFAPAGLDIGATTPEEIALSIAAEIRSHFAGRNGMSLRLRRETIYGD
ncbi:MAG: XdhC family protein [Chitinophagaceae bacterium]